MKIFSYLIIKNDCNDSFVLWCWDENSWIMSRQIFIGRLPFIIYNILSILEDSIIFIAFPLNHRVTTWFIFLTYDWFVKFFSQLNVRNNDYNISIPIRLLYLNTSINRILLFSKYCYYLVAFKAKWYNWINMNSYVTLTHIHL